MARTRKVSRTILLYYCLLFFWEFWEPGTAFSAICADGTGVPPFVGTDAVDPNVLLMIDNSASMLDLAAVGAEGICYDGTDDQR